GSASSPPVVLVAHGTVDLAGQITGAISRLEVGDPAASTTDGSLTGYAASVPGARGAVMFLTYAATLTGSPGTCTVSGSVSALPVRERVYIANARSHDVSVFDSATGSVVATVPVGHIPFSLVADATSGRIYTANAGEDTV